MHKTIELTGCTIIKRAKIDTEDEYPLQGGGRKFTAKLFLPFLIPKAWIRKELLLKWGV